MASTGLISNSGEFLTYCYDIWLMCYTLNNVLINNSVVLHKVALQFGRQSELIVVLQQLLFYSTLLKQIELRYK